MDRATTQHTNADRLDHMAVSRLHCLAIGLCAFGFAFDLFEIGLGNALAAVFSAPPHAAEPSRLSMLLASVYAGAVVGSPLAGWLGDRYGRRSVLMGVLLLIALASLGAAGSDGIVELAWWRCLAGLALGGYPPLMIAYLTDLLPAARRGTLIMIVVAISTLGPAAGIFLVRALTPIAPLGIDAWRWAFVAGSIGTGAAGLLFRFLPESPRWLEARGRLLEAEAQADRLERSPAVLAPAAPVPAPEHDAQPAVRGAAWRRWPLVAALFFLSPWATVAFPLLSGAVLTQKGYQLSDALLFVGLSTFGPLFGTLLASLGIDRIGRRTAIAVCAAVMLGSGALFVAGDTPAVLIVSSFVFSLFVIVCISVLNLYASELFPTGSRASAIAGAWMFNRVGAACAPLLLLPLLHGAGPASMFLVVAATLLASVVLLAFAPAGRPRRAVR